MLTRRLLWLRLAGVLLLVGATGATAQTTSAPATTRSAAGAEGGTRPAAEAPSDAAIEKLLRRTLEASKIPAMGVAVIRDCKTASVTVAGVRAAGSAEPVTVDDLWHLGSCGKAMTATCIATLVDEGKLRWDSTLADVFPELRDGMNADFRGVTLELLLSHRGGVPAELTVDGLGLKLRMSSDSLTEKRLMIVRSVTAHEPASKPGTQTLYSNAGVTIAAAMAERVTGKGWETLIRERLFEPLGMKSVGFGAPGDASGGKIDQPRGHRQDGEAWSAVPPGPLADNPPAISPAGTMHMSLVDWSRFVALHLDAGAGRPRLVKADSFARMHKPAESGAPSFGWGKLTRPWGGNVLTHAGSNTMWFCVVWAAPEKGLAVLVVSNAGGDAVAKACDGVAGAVLLDLTGDKPLPR